MVWKLICVFIALTSEQQEEGVCEPADLGRQQGALKNGAQELTQVDEEQHKEREERKHGGAQPLGAVDGRQEHWELGALHVGPLATRARLEHAILGPGVVGVVGERVDEPAGGRDGHQAQERAEVQDEHQDPWERAVAVHAASEHGTHQAQDGRQQSKGERVRKMCIVECIGPRGQ